MKPQIYNKYHKIHPADSVSIMRGSPWGNKFSHQQGTLAEFNVSSREEAVKQHSVDLFNDYEKVLEIQKHLKGKNLLCVCKPKECHGDTLLFIANDLNIEDLTPSYNDFI